MNDDEPILGVMYLRQGDRIVRHNVALLWTEEVTEEADPFKRWRFLVTNLDDMHFVRTAHQDTR